MYLNQEQRYNVTMKMLSIVEHMAFGREPQAIAPQAARHPVMEDSDETDMALNAIIKQQLNIGNADLIGDDANG